MKLFLVATEFHRTRGGIQYVNRLLLRAFAQMARQTPLSLSVFSYGDRPQDLREHCHDLEAPRAFGRSGMRMGLALARALAKQRPDVVLFTHVRLLPFARLVRRLAPRARVAVLTHGIEVWSPLPAAIRGELQRAHSVVAPSAFTGARLREHNGVTLDQLTIVPHGLDPDWTSGDPREPISLAPTLLTVSRLNTADQPKGVDVVLRAMPHILDRVPEARYVVVGDGDDRPRLEQLAADLGVASAVEFRGEIDGARLGSVYAEAGVFVLPSTKEGFGIVLAEAMWMRLPVVAARFGPAEEVIEDGVTGLLVPPGNPEQTASAVCGLLLLEADRRRMGEAGRCRVEERYLFPQFAARWHRWLAGVAPEAVYLARRARSNVATDLGSPRASR